MRLKQDDLDCLAPVSEMINNKAIGVVVSIQC